MSKTYQQAFQPDFFLIFSETVIFKRLIDKYKPPHLPGSFGFTSVQFYNQLPFKPHLQQSLSFFVFFCQHPHD